ncbi:MAG: Glyoxalase/Bleomycin resistance protein/Dioxygenase superfamily [Chloroflexota bacterium]|nr:Glyoxalase/Bleomycin resistance protein/Dioxygenase superfamily [Chloroflexota bacterium]
MTSTESRTDSVVKTLGIHHAGIPVNNVDRAVEFYSRVLGWELVGQYRVSDGKGHFTGSAPVELNYEVPGAEQDFREFVEHYEQVRPGHTPRTCFARMKVGPDEVVLFERPEPIEIDTLVDNGVFHQSFHISAEDMQRLADLKREGGSDIKFHTGPTLRWPHGRALYMWDTEGNYIELESIEDLPAVFGVSHELKRR